MPHTMHDDRRDRDETSAAAADSASQGSDQSQASDQEPDVHGVPDASLGGYLDTHDRPPAFEGPDGHPYTVSLEVEQTPDLRAPYVGYLVFPRWAATGLGVIGHVQTPVLCRERGRATAEDRLRELSLDRVKSLLDEGIERAGGQGDGEPRPDPYSFGSE